MATSTENYNFKKPDESDFYDIADENKNWDLADEALKNLDTPTFEDYTGSTAVPAATDAINQMKSKRKLGVLLSNIKAAFKGACLIGHIVNNCVTDNAGLPLSAAQGKALMDKYTQLYSDMSKRFGNIFVDFSICPSLDVLDTGIYNINNYDGKIANVPFAGGTFMCITAQQGDSYKYQIASKATDLASRSLTNGIWSDWTYYAQQRDVPYFKALELIGNTPFIDFHFNNSDTDYTSRIIEQASGELNFLSKLYENGKRVAVSENAHITFRNDEGYLKATIGTLDIGCIPSILGHKLKLVWNGELNRMYVWMDGIQLGYLSILQ